MVASARLLNLRQTRNRIGKVEAQTELRVQSGGTERARVQSGGTERAGRAIKHLNHGKAV